MATIICPYCLDKLSPTSIKRVCNVCGTEAPNDFKTNLAFKMGQVPRCKEKGCLGIYSKLQCGLCEHELPADITQYNKYMRFAVVSHSGGGKTNYITTLLEELKTNRTLKFYTAHMNNETLEYHSDNVRQLYDNRSMIPPNPPGEINPLQWRIQDLGRKTRTTTPCYSMTIFDGAGEDLQNVDPLVCRYLTGSKMILLLLDPTRLYGVRAQMTREEIEGAGGDPDEYISPSDTQTFVQGLINYLKTSTGVRVDKQLKQPVAVVFGKIDAVERLLGSARVLQPSDHVNKGTFNRSEAETIHREIESFMDACGDNLNGLFDANFSTWKYFGISSFGFLPKGSSALERPQPLRVLDPLMWNFSMEGIVTEK